MVRGRLTWRKQKERWCVNCRRKVFNERMYKYKYLVQSGGSLVNPKWQLWDFFSCKKCGSKISTVQKCVGYFRKEYSSY